MSDNPKAQVVFVANHEPPLKDGLYSLSLTHKLTYDSNPKSFVKTHHFAVAGERFALNSGVIHKLFPPANSHGHFDNVLPHVVLTRRTLPWERVPDGSAETSSWLAILVFTDSVAPKPQRGHLCDLYPATTKDKGGTLTSDTYSYGTGLGSSDYFLSYGEKTDDPCTFIDIPRDQFAAFAPSLNDLAWNAHARTLTKGADTPKDFATVVANRLPIPGTTCRAHLVSLENLGDQLPKDDGTITSTSSWTKIRLVSLKSWSFHVAPLEASFASLLRGLNAGVDKSGSEQGDSQIRLPAGYKPAAAAGLTSPSLAFDSGYTVLAGQDGAASTQTWYRGPWAPSTITPLGTGTSLTSNPLPANKAADLSVSVSTEPASDCSYAAAWQLGRLLALADRPFATEQVAWKRDLRLALNTKQGQANKLAGGSRAAYAKEVRKTIASVSRIQGYLGTGLTTSASDDKLTIPQGLVDWLGQLALLNKIPVDYLVPDSNMLPPESLKFFAIDPRWLACLLDGAWSLDRQPSDNWKIDTAYQPWQQIQSGSLTTSMNPSLASWPISGAILNSRLIPDYWPGIQFLTTPQANVLREDRLGASTLLLLFDQPLTKLEVRQPPEAMHFGFDMDASGAISKALKYVEISNTLYPTPPGGTTPAAGSPAPSSVALGTIPQRLPKLIQFDKLAAAMATELGVTDTSKFSTAEFALELVETIAAATFTLPSEG